MKTYLKLTGAFALAAVTGCTSLDTGSRALESAGAPANALCEAGSLGQAIRSTGPVPEGCVKIEGADIGRVPQSLEVDGDIGIELSTWQSKDGEAGEFIGFTVTVTGGDVVFAVKAGGETYAGEGVSWVHPKGTGGDQASAISNITFCPAPEAAEGDGAGEAGDGDGIEENPGAGGDSAAPCPVEGAGDGAGDTGGSTGTGGTEAGGEGGVFPESPAPGSPGAQCSSDSECNEGLSCLDYRCSSGIN